MRNLPAELTSEWENITPVQVIKYRIKSGIFLSLGSPVDSTSLCRRVSVQGGEGGAPGGGELQPGAGGPGGDGDGGGGWSGGGRPLPPAEERGREEVSEGEEWCGDTSSPGPGGSPNHQSLSRLPSFKSSPPASSSVRSTLRRSSCPSKTSYKIRGHLDLSEAGEGSTNIQM